MTDLSKRLDRIEAALAPDAQLDEHRRIAHSWLAKQLARVLGEKLPDECARFIEQVPWVSAYSGPS